MRQAINFPAPSSLLFRHFLMHSGRKMLFRPLMISVQPNTSIIKRLNSFFDNAFLIFRERITSHLFEDIISKIVTSSSVHPDSCSFVKCFDQNVHTITYMFWFRPSDTTRSFSAHFLLADRVEVVKPVSTTFAHKLRPHAFVTEKLT